MKALILLATALGCQAAPQPFFSAIPSVAAPVDVPAVPVLPLQGLSAMQHRTQDELGNVAFSHFGGPNSRSEIRSASGAQVGSFSYIDGEGKVQLRIYISDALGTRVLGTDLPVPPEETPEVAKARATLAELQESSGGRSRRSVSTFPVLRYGTTPLSHFAKAGTFALPMTTYSTFPYAMHVVAPGTCPKLVASALAKPTIEAAKVTLKSVSTLNPKLATVGDRPAPSPVLLRAGPAQPMVAASVPSPSVALATKPGPSTIVVKASSAQPVAAVDITAQPTLAAAAPPAPIPALVKAVDAPVPVAIQSRTSSFVSKPVPVQLVGAAPLAPHPVLFKSAPSHLAVPAPFSPAVALATKPGPFTVVVKSAPAQTAWAAGVGSLPAPTPILVKAADTQAVAVSAPSSPPVALATKPGPSTVVVKSAPAQPVASLSVVASPAVPPVSVKATPAQLVVPGPVTSPAVTPATKSGPSTIVVKSGSAQPVATVGVAAPPAVPSALVKASPAHLLVPGSVASPGVALATKPGPSTIVVKSGLTPLVATGGIAAQAAVTHTDLPAPVPVLLKAADGQAMTLSDASSPQVALAVRPGPSAVVVKSTPAQPVAAVAQPAAPSVLVKAVPAAAVAVTAPLPEPLEAPSPPAPSPEVPFRGGKFHSQDELGQYTFGHFGGSHTRVETKNFLGHTRGSFAYVNPEGEVHVRKYAAGPDLGFTVAGSDLPVDTNHPVGETLGVTKARKTLLTLLHPEKKAKARIESAGPAVIAA